MYAIVENGGKQYRLDEGVVLNLEKLEAEVGSEVELDKVLLTSDYEKVQVGQPYLEAKVVCQILEHGRGPKVIIFKHKKRKDYRKKMGHRQDFTKVKVKSIQTS